MNTLVEAWQDLRNRRIKPTESNEAAMLALASFYEGAIAVLTIIDQYQDGFKKELAIADLMEECDHFVDLALEIQEEFSDGEKTKEGS